MDITSIQQQMANISDIEANECLRNLLFLSNIGMNEKICCSTLSIYKNNLFTNLRRTVNFLTTEDFESRTKTIRFVQETFERALSIIQGLETTDIDRKVYVVIVDNLQKATKGVNNLISTTYKEDNHFCSTLSAFLIFFEARMKLSVQYKNKLYEENL